MTVGVIVALLLAALFGGSDQYLGSLSAHPWATDLSLLSAPWLLVAFVAGCTQRRPRPAALIGLACTVAALSGYGLMTMSPIENAHLSTHALTGFLRSETLVIAGGIVTGPVFGWLGYRWHSERNWFAALAAAGAVCLEPLAHAVIGAGISDREVSLAEVAAGLAMVVYIAVARAPAQGRARRDAT